MVVEPRRVPRSSSRSWSAALAVALVLVMGACSTDSEQSASGASVDTTGAEGAASSVDGLETTSVPSPTLTADGGDGGEDNPTTEAADGGSSTTSTTPVAVENTVPGCEPADVVIEPLGEPLPAEIEEVRQAILEAHAVCDLDGLLALTDPAALISDPGDDTVLVLDFGDQEPVSFDQLPFEIIPNVLNEPWTATQNDAAVEVAIFTNGSHELHLTADGLWTAFLAVVS